MKRERRWVLAPRNGPAGDAKFSDTFCALPCIAILLQRRGLLSDEQATDFLHPRLRSLSDPFLLPDMRAAVDRILRAITTGERIVLYGDYDVDGVTSLALLSEMLCAYGARPTPFLPSRMEEGYGLSREGIERCWQTHRPQLLIAVDCGTSSSAEIANLRARGVEVIVLDHHEPKGDTPGLRCRRESEGRGQLRLLLSLQCGHRLQTLPRPAENSPAPRASTCGNGSTSSPSGRLPILCRWRRRIGSLSIMARVNSPFVDC